MPTTEGVMNTSITVSWEDPGGTVDAYIVRYTQTAPHNEVVNVTVTGTVLSTTLTGLEPSTSYTVEVFSMNSNGVSLIASPSTSFDTLRKYNT